MRLKLGTAMAVTIAVAAVVVTLSVLGPFQTDKQDGLTDAALSAPVTANSNDSDDFAIEFRRLKPEADQGDAWAQYVIGGMYDTGNGVPKDDVEARKYFLLAANQGYKDAQVYLGNIYATGQGVRKNDVEAYKWLNLAASQGADRAGEMRDGIAIDMTPAQIAEAQKLSREWKRK